MSKIRFRSLVLSSFFIASAVQAQEIFRFNSGGGGFNVQAGVQKLDFSDYFQDGKEFDCGMGQRTRDTVGGVFKSVFNKPSTTVLTWGLQGYGAFNSIILGGEINGFAGASASGTQTDTYRNPQRTALFGTTTRVAGGDVLLNVGLVAYRKRRLVAYPMVSVGYGASGLWLQSESDKRAYPKLAQVVTSSDNNLQNIFIWTRNVVADFGIGAQYMLGSSTEDRAKGFSLGLRVGYKMQLASDDILVNGNKKAKDSFPASANVTLPSMGLSGLYAKLLIGFGRIGESR